MSTNNLTASKKMDMLLDSLNISANKLSIRLDYSSPATIYHIKEGRNKTISVDMIHRIVKEFPHVNYKFLKDDILPVLLTDKNEIQAQLNILGIQAPIKDTPNLFTGSTTESLQLNSEQYLSLILQENMKQTKLLEKIANSLEKEE